MTFQHQFGTRLRIGLVGAGGHAQRNVLPALAYLPVELVAVCDADREKAKSVARQYGALGAYDDLESMLSNEHIDAVLLVVSAQMHSVLAAQAFDAGLHVWMEKPPALRASLVEDLLAKRGDRICVVGFKKVFMPAAKKAREFFDDPANGPVRSLHADYPVTMPVNGPEVLAEGQVTNWLNNGCHPLSLMLSVCGAVNAVTTTINRYGEGVLVMEFANGAVGALHLADGAGITAPNELYRFHGLDCTLTIENGWRVSIHRRDADYRYGETQSYLDTLNPALVWEPQNAFVTLEAGTLFTQGIYFELAHFCDCVLRGAPATVGALEFAGQVIRVYEAALQSAGNRIAL